jgi:hypothetical protein
MNTMNGIFYAAGVIGGVLLMVGPFVGTGRVAPRWIRRALWMTGPACVVWAVLGFSLLWGVRDPYGYVRHFKTTFGGIVIGILCLLLASGEFRSSMKGDANRP